MDILYERIKNIRELRGLTQEELALKVGYTGRSSINRVEKGLVDIPRDKIKAIASALGVSEMYLMGYEENDIDPYTEELIGIATTLNQEGKEKLIEYAQDLSASGRYKKSGIVEVLEENA